MLDRASIERLAQAPESNDPLLNVALAEEGDGGVLLALARCGAVGPEALEIVAARVAREGDSVGGAASDQEGVRAGEEPDGGAADELDRQLIRHSNAPGS